MLFKVGFGDIFGLMRGQCRPQDRQLPVALGRRKPLAASSMAAPTQRHLGIPPAFDVAPDLPNGRAHTAIEPVGVGLGPDHHEDVADAERGSHDEEEDRGEYIQLSVAGAGGAMMPRAAII